MKQSVLGFGACVLAVFIPFEHAHAQDEGPPTRIVVASSFKLPLGPERDKAIDFMTEYFLPNWQLNPNVHNFRLLFHRWGSDGADVLVVSEYDDLAALAAGCGQPCTDYYAQHEPPEVGEAGYEEYREKLDAFTRAYSNHRDETYVTRMDRAVVEGQMQGGVGLAPEGDD